MMLKAQVYPTVKMRRVMEASKRGNTNHRAAQAPSTIKLALFLVA